MSVAKQLWMSAVALIITVVFFGVSGTDIWVQNHFYNPITQQWLIDHDEPVLKFIFYDGIKRLIIIVDVVILITLIIGWKKPSLALYRKGLVIVLLSGIFVPVVVGSFKALTNLPCPKNLEIYGGNYPHTCVWEKYPKSFCQQGKIKCWPAGHASGGFALLSLIYLFRTRKAKIIAGTSAMVIGWSMGTYKMLIGDHFLSHTFITMVMAWFIISLIVYVIERTQKRRKQLKMV
jgi:membrane-associated PAP2 superfamily phosphatase